MAVRMTQGLMYNSFVNNMNRTLGDYMETNIQSSSQKKVNRPSDDPVAAGRIMDSRARLSNLSLYEENIKTAMGWLSTADSVLGSGKGSVSELLRTIKTLAEQAATETNNKENRYEISMEIRQHFEQLINIANTEFGGNHIFGGHKTGQPAYREGLAVTMVDDQTPEANRMSTSDFYVVDGKLDRTMIIQPIGAAGATVSVDTPDYRYSLDGGETWIVAEQKPTLVGSLSDPDAYYEMRAGGVVMRIPATYKDSAGNVQQHNHEVTCVPPNNTGPGGSATDGPENIHNGNNGSWLYVRPTAIYQGDIHNNQVAVTYRADAAGTHAYNNSTDPSDPNYVRAEGNFSRDVAVRLDSLDTSSTPPTLTYSYSVDDGSNWVTSSVPYDATPGADLSIPIPGGYLTLGEAPDASDMGMQFSVNPYRADIEFPIANDSTVKVNLVGKDVFGGLYDDPTDGIGHALPVEFTNGGNLFEVIGNLIAAAETGDVDACSAALEQIDAVRKIVDAKVAEVGGRENRLDATYSMHLIRQYSEEDTLSRVEDADVTELMTRLAQQQIAYQSVLKSSSMIMQMSLVNFL